MKESSILVVDDEKNILSSIGMTLETNGYHVITAENGLDALGILEKNRVDVMLLDIMMPQMDGLEALRRAKETHHNLSVIIMSGHGTISNAVQATKLGAYDFLEKPISREKLLLSISRAISFRRLENENIELRSQMARKYDMIGESAGMRELIRRIETIGASPSRALICGENGVGKELVARALHQASPRSSQPFIKVNCAAIPKELIESELLGHEKGSFTGATAMRRGKFELAHHGTIFLDEVADMHLETQAKVLRVLQEHEFQRVGGDSTIKVDVRVIAATNKDLESEIRKNNFREDLYYRLNVIPIIVPPLRERKMDIPLLARHFLENFAGEYGRSKKTITEDAIKNLCEYHWPGNVRELGNFIERLYIMCQEDVIEAAVVDCFLPVAGQGASVVQDIAAGVPLKDAMQEFEKKFIENKLIEMNYRMSEVARALQIERSHLYKKIKALGITTP